MYRPYRYTILPSAFYRRRTTLHSMFSSHNFCRPQTQVIVLWFSVCACVYMCEKKRECIYVCANTEVFFVGIWYQTRNRTRLECLLIKSYVLKTVNGEVTKEVSVHVFWSVFQYLMLPSTSREEEISYRH